MERSVTLLKLFSTVFPFADFLYLLQLEEYQPKRYWKLLSRFFFRRNIQLRNNLKWTKHIAVVLAASLSYIPFSIGIWVYLTNMNRIPISVTGFVPIFLLILFSVSVPVQVGVAATLLDPLYQMWNKHVEKKAALLIKMRTPKLKVVGITGSYGKTTTKEFAYELVRHVKRTQAVPGNINTAIGISEWLLRELRVDTELLIVEMSAYARGEIHDSCKIVPPDIAVITNFGDQHLERFGSFENLVQAKLEIFEYAKSNALRIIPNAFKVYLPKNISAIEVPMYKELIYQKNPYTSNILSPSLRLNLQLALAIAETLDVNEAFVKDSLLHLTVVERRQQEIVTHDFQTLDDSYNISFQTGTRAVELASKRAHELSKQLLVITAGIPEAGVTSAPINKAYGVYLSKHVDEIFLLNSIFSCSIREGLASGNFAQESIRRANTMKEAWRQITLTFNPRDVYILMQPELTDLSY